MAEAEQKALEDMRKRYEDLKQEIEKRDAADEAAAGEAARLAGEAAGEESSAEDAAGRYTGGGGYDRYLHGFYGGRAEQTASFGGDQRERPQVILKPKEKKTPRYSGDIVSFITEFKLHLDSTGLLYTLDPPVGGAGPIFFINGGTKEDRIVLHGEKKVSDHERAYHKLLEATEGAEFRPKILAMGCVSGAWSELLDHCLPSSDVQKQAMKQELTNMTMNLGEDPRKYFLRFDKVLVKFRAVDGVITDSEVITILRRNLSADYEILQSLLLLEPLP